MAGPLRDGRPFLFEIMKKILSLAVLAAGFGLWMHWLASTPARAASFTPGMALSTINTTIASVGASATNSTNAINVEGQIYHTFHVVSLTTTAELVNLDRSLDNVNWVPFFTNAVSNTTTEFTMTGKWSWFRARILSTNGQVSVNYLGGGGP